MAPVNAGFFIISWACTCYSLISRTTPYQGPQGECWNSLPERDSRMSVRAPQDLPLGPGARHQRSLLWRRYPSRTKSGLWSFAGRATQRFGKGRQRQKRGHRLNLNSDAEGFLQRGTGGMNRPEDPGPNATVSISRVTPDAASSKGHTQHAVMRQMVKAAGHRQQWKDAIVMFDKMQAEGVPPVKAAYAAALRACAKGAEWERGTELLDNYLEEGYALDDGVVTAVVKACCRAGRPSEAEAVLKKSLARGLVPEVSLFSAVMNACYTVGDIDSILSLGEQLRAQRLNPDDNAFHLIVTSHICKSDWVSATKVLVEMGAAGLTPSARSTRQWRLASAAIEEIDLDVDEGPGDDYYEDTDDSPWNEEAPRDARRYAER